ncbi:MAG: UDP-N-acetylmuramate:L-alanyl-gamma-D-glutamyl-meso-diaminopimelate ligase [Verrucomicrobiota bacterium]
MAKEIKQIHFVGICGTAMGSVAAALKQRGCTVTGSDANVYPPMSTFLEEQGIELHSGFSATHIPESTDLVVVGNAISRGNEEAETVLERKLLYTSLPEILKSEFLRGKSNFVVTGTHGKTTTSTMLTWILVVAGRDPGFMIGGIPRNLGEGARFTDSDCVVLEGDEYDTAFFDKRSKFLHYLPEVVIVNNIEFDHADIFDDLDQIKLSFRRLLNVVPRNGVAFVNGDDANCLDVASGSPAPVVKVGLGEACDRQVVDIVYEPSLSRFDLDGETYSVPMNGEFNVRNAAMTVCAALHAGVSPDLIREALASFEGIARRQELRGTVRGIRVVDDFAHHPTAIAGALTALRQQYPEGRLWAVFEPRSNTTRRNVFQDSLPQALSGADGVLLPPIAFPEKTPEAERLDPRKVIDKLKAGGTEAYFEESTEAIISRLKKVVAEPDVIAILSNGGFDNIHERLLQELA